MNDAASSAVGVDAVLFREDLPGGRTAGRLEVVAGAVRFRMRAGAKETGDPEIADFPLGGLRLRLGGAADRMLFLEHPDRPGCVAATSDRGLLDDPAFAADGPLGSQVGKIRSRRRRGRAVTLGILLGLLAVVVGLFRAKDPLVGVVVDRIPHSLEQKIGQVVWGQVQATTTIVRDEEVTEDLERLAEPLLAAIPREEGGGFRVHLAHDGNLNAFALPGGDIVLNSGLVLAAETPEEVLGVLAHEIAHVTERHSLQQIVGTLGLYAIVQAVLGDVSGLAAVLADGGLRLASLRFSRDHERDADRVGWETLVRAGIDPRGMTSFFETLEREQAERAGDLEALESTLGFLSTHPATEERIEELRRRAEAEEIEDRDWRGSEIDLVFGELRDTIAASFESSTTGSVAAE